MVKKSISFLLFCVFFEAQARGALLNCSGDFLIKDRSGKVHSLESGISLDKNKSFHFLILDKKKIHLLTVFPWDSIQYKIKLGKKEQVKRNLIVDTNGMSWISVTASDPLSNEKQKTFCEFEGE